MRASCWRPQELPEEAGRLGLGASSCCLLVAGVGYAVGAEWGAVGSREVRVCAVHRTLLCGALYRG